MVALNTSYELQLQNRKLSIKLLCLCFSMWYRGWSSHLSACAACSCCHSTTSPHGRSVPAPSLQVKELQQTMEKLSRAVVAKKTDLEEEVLETQAAEIQLAKAAEDCR